MSSPATGKREKNENTVDRQMAPPEPRPPQPPALVHQNGYWHLDQHPHFAYVYSPTNVTQGNQNSGT